MHFGQMLEQLVAAIWDRSEHAVHSAISSLHQHFEERTQPVKQEAEAVVQKVEEAPHEALQAAEAEVQHVTEVVQGDTPAAQ